MEKLNKDQSKDVSGGKCFTAKYEKLCLRCLKPIGDTMLDYSVDLTDNDTGKIYNSHFLCRECFNELTNQ